MQCPNHRMLVALLVLIVLQQFSIHYDLIASTKNDTMMHLFPRQRRPTKHNTKKQRFPSWGSPEFSKQCAWALPPAKTKYSVDCTIFVRPYKESHEGIAWWLTEIASNYMFAQQAHCQMLFDYGPNIDLSHILKLLSSANNWTSLSPSFNCTIESHCYRHPFDGMLLQINNTLSFQHSRHDGSPLKIQQIIPEREPLESVPRYRYAMIDAHLKKEDNHLYENMLPHLTKKLPGFQLKTGMACALGSLVDLALPDATKYEPRILDLLDALRQDDTLVMGLYIRAGNGLKHRNSDSIYNCTLSLEQKYLFGSVEEHHQNRNNANMLFPEPNYSRVIWMVVTDTQQIKEEFSTKFNNTMVQFTTNSSDFTAAKVLPQVIPRHVWVTSSQGTHTRKDIRYKTNLGEDVSIAEAFIDWFLLGESDAVITNPGFSTFGSTAAMRTALPVYDWRPFESTGSCPEVPLVYPVVVTNAKVRT